MAMASVAAYCIIPMQDFLGLDDKARMNIPSTLGGNWKWRYKTEDLSIELKERISGYPVFTGAIRWIDI